MRTSNARLRFGIIPQMADSVWSPTAAAAAPARSVRLRHSAVVRVTHWVTTLAFLALLLTGIEILISHPRFYWGEAGNVMTPPLFKLPIPASRHSVPTGYGYVLPDQNGWSRYLHFQAAWVAVLTGLLYFVFGVVSGHFRRNLLPSRADVSGRGLSRVIGEHLRFRRAGEEEAWSYNVLQRITYLFVIFVFVSADHLDRPGYVARDRVRVSVLGEYSGRPTIRAHYPFLCDDRAGAFSAGSHRDGLCVRVP